MMQYIPIDNQISISMIKYWWSIVYESISNAVNPSSSYQFKMRWIINLRIIDWNLKINEFEYICNVNSKIKECIRMYIRWIWKWINVFKWNVYRFKNECMDLNGWSMCICKWMNVLKWIIDGYINEWMDLNEWSM